MEVDGVFRNMFENDILVEYGIIMSWFDKQHPEYYSALQAIKTQPNINVVLLNDVHAVIVDSNGSDCAHDKTTLSPFLKLAKKTNFHIG